MRKNKIQSGYCRLISRYCRRAGVVSLSFATGSLTPFTFNIAGEALKGYLCYSSGHGSRLQHRGLENMSDFIIGVDLGGTNVRAARLDRDLNILQREAE